jgi:hypothetical protein
MLVLLSGCSKLALDISIKAEPLALYITLQKNVNPHEIMAEMAFPQ